MMAEKCFMIGTYAPMGKPSVWEAVLNTETAELRVRPVSALVENPSWLLAHPKGDILYAVEEKVPEGKIAALKRSDGEWKPVCRLPAGSAPCHLALDDQARFLFCSNYMDGTLSVYRLDPEGIPQEQTDLLVHSGHGRNPDRQEGPHLHSAWFHEGKLLTVDLGLDLVSVCDLDRERGRMTESRRISLPAGSGPRHIAFHPAHPDLLYVVAELNGRVYVVSASAGKVLQEVPVVPENRGEASRSAAVHFAGDTLYASTREYESVALCTLREDGLLDEARVYLHAQKTPRDVWMDERFCITADEGSCALTLLRRTGSTLTQCGVVSTGTAKPTCILPRFPVC